MSGHTLGPWEFIGDPDGDECRIRQSSSVKRGRGYISEITICENIQTKANANLIAAAPDLLKALEGMLDRYTGLVNCGDCGSWDPESEVEVIDARKAITRAKGQFK